MKNYRVFKLKFCVLFAILYGYKTYAQTTSGSCSNAGPDQSICSSDEVILNGSVSSSTTSVIWTTNGDGTFSDSIGLNSDYIPGPFDIIHKSVVLTLTINNASDSCIYASDNMVLTIHSSPATPAAITGAPVSICPPSNGIILQTNNDPHATSYSWISSNPSVVFPATSVTNIQSVNILPGNGPDYTIEVIAVNVCGVSPMQAITISRTIEVPVLNGPSVACGNTTQTYSSNSISGASSYKWKGPAGVLFNGNAGIYITTDTVVNVTFPAGFNNGNISVAARTSCFTSDYRTLKVSKSLPPLAPISGPSPVCSPVSQTYTVPVVQGTAYHTWTLPANTTGNSTNSSLLVNFDNAYEGSANLCVNATSICGAVTPTKCKLIAKGRPAAPGNISGPLNNTCGLSAAYSVTNVQGISYNWTVPSGVTINGAQNGNSIAVVFPSNINTGQVRVKATNSCGTSPLSSITVTGAPAIPGGIESNPHPVRTCDSNVQFTADVSSLSSNCTFTWTYPASVTYVSGQNTPNLILNWSNENGTVTLTASNSCGSFVRSSFIDLKSRRETGNTNQPDNDSEIPEANVENNSSLNLQAYPDPDQKTITFTFNANEPGSYFYNLTDDSNREVRSGIIDAQQSGVNMQDLDMASLPSEIIYTLNLTDGKNSTHIKIRMQ